MKAVLFFLAVFATSSSAFAAANTCSYKLDQEEYWEDASGDLSFNGREYRCKTIMIGEDMVTLCSDKELTDSPNYQFIVAFDGAEADFGVYNTLDFSQGSLCSGQAVTK